MFRAISSVGRAGCLHRQGREFEPLIAHHLFLTEEIGLKIQKILLQPPDGDVKARKRIRLTLDPFLFLFCLISFNNR